MTTTRLQKKKERKREEEKVGGHKKNAASTGRSKGKTERKASIANNDIPDVSSSFDVAADLAALSALRLESSGSESDSGSDTVTGTSRTGKSSRKGRVNKQYNSIRSRSILTFIKQVIINFADA